MEWNYFIGIDVSKLTLDFCINRGKEKVFSTVIDNQAKALSRLWKELYGKFPDFHEPQVLCCFEHKGIYNEHLLSFLASKKVSIAVENPTQIKLSVGLTRGKNDKVDAERIARYAYKEREAIKLWEPTREVIKTLKHLSVLRVRLIGVRKSLTVPQTEIKAFDKGASKMMTALCKSTLKSVEKDLDGVDIKI